MNKAILKIALKTGLVTAIIILLYQASNLLLYYKFIKLDWYMAAIALAALVTGIIIARRQPVPILTGHAVANPFEQLTNKEMQIFLLMAEGQSNKEIAATNFVEMSTIKTHINHIYAKLQVNNRKQAVALFYKCNTGAKSTLYPPPAV